MAISTTPNKTIPPNDFTVKMLMSFEHESQRQTLPRRPEKQQRFANSAPAYSHPTEKETRSDHLITEMSGAMKRGRTSTSPPSSPTHKRPKPADASRDNVSPTMAILKSILDRPYTLGVAIGELLNSIPSLVSAHMSQPITFSNAPPRASVPTAHFTRCIDTQLARLRAADEERGQDSRDQSLGHYTFIVELAFKEVLVGEFEEVMGAWGGEETRSFNRGFDWGLTGTAWSVYPEECVVARARAREDWGVWIRGRCEVLGIEEAARGRRVFDDA